MCPLKTERQEEMASRLNADKLTERSVPTIARHSRLILPFPSQTTVQWTGHPVALLCPSHCIFRGRRKRYNAMAEHVKELNPQDPTHQQDQKSQQPRPLTKNEMDDLRWVVEQELRKELGVPPKWYAPKFKIEFHRRQLALLEQANHAPRCEHVFTDGRSCGAPRVKKGKMCYAHTLMDEKRPRLWNLPPLEDANAVTLWLMDVSRRLLDGTISERTAGLMFYGLQLAMMNARHTTFKETDHAEMVRRAPKEFIAKDAKEKEEDWKDREPVKLASETGGTEEEQGRKLPRRQRSQRGPRGLTAAESIFSGVEAGVG